jgi:hypothetical protein
LAGHLLVSQAGGEPNGIFDVDPVAKTVALFSSFAADGMALSPDGTTLFLASGPGLRGLDMVTKTIVFETAVPGADGVAIGEGALAGKVYVNCTQGQLWEVDVATSNQVLIADCGSRGDFLIADCDGSLLITQSDRVKRLRLAGGSWYGMPGSAGDLHLMPDAAARGFLLTTFATGFPVSTAPGPIGAVFRPDGAVLWSDHDTGGIYLFPNSADGQTATTVPLVATYPGASALARLPGPRYFLAAQASGKVLELTADGALVQEIATVAHVTAMVPVLASPATPALTNHLLVSQAGGSPNGIFDVDPVARTATLFSSNAADGLVITPDGKTLYMASGPGLRGLDVPSKTIVFETDLPGADGVALGQGALTNKVYVNCTPGQLWEVDVTTTNKVLIADCGTRGDFAIAACDGSLFITQSDRVKRLRLAGASWYGGCPTGPVTLTFTRVGGALRLTWPTGTLQSATSVTGPFVDVAGAVSPYTVTPTSPAKFYRVRL